MAELELRMVFEDQMVVEPGQSTSLLVPGLPEVLTTAALVSFLQLTVARGMAPHLDDGQFTVGTKISIEQLASTPVGMTLTATARLAWIKDRRIGFTVEASDPYEQVCKGIHERYIVDVEWFRQRAEAKLAQWKASAA